MPRNRYSRFRDGVQISGVAGFFPQSGQVLYVGNSTQTLKLGIVGSDNNDGLTPEHPMATLSVALTRCVASRGDVIVLLPYHSETLTASLAINIAGVSVIGMGLEDARPLFILATNATAGITLTGANSSLQNVIVKDNVGATVAVKAAAVGAAIMGCDIRDGSSSFTTGISVVGGGANLADKAEVSDNVLFSTGATNGILLGEVDDKVQVLRNRIMGSFSQSAIHNPTSKVLTNARIDENKIENTNASGYGVRMISAVTGEAMDNRIFAAQGKELVAPNLALAGNRGTSTLGGADYALPNNPTFANDPDVPQALVSAIKSVPATAVSPGTTIFTVAGGPIRIEYLSVEVTTAIGATACTMQFATTDTLTSTTQTISGASADTQSIAAGRLVVLDPVALSTAPVITAAGGSALANAAAGDGSLGGISMIPGVCSLITSGSPSGNIKYHLRYVPLDPNASVTMS